jgi:hypothetical protein
MGCAHGDPGSEQSRRLLNGVVAAFDVDLMPAGGNRSRHARARACALLLAVASLLGVLVAGPIRSADAAPAAVTYSCPSGGSLSGSTCTMTQAATWNSGYYYCPSGGTLSGTSCVTSSYYVAYRNWQACPAGYYTSYYVGECWFRTSTSACQASGSATYSEGTWTYTFSWPTGCYSSTNITMRGYTWSCPNGGSLNTGYSPARCTTSTSYAASYQQGWYTCPGGWSLSGSTCSWSYAATATYSCPSGGVLSGTRCLPTPVAVNDGPGGDVAYARTTPLLANWTAATGVTIADYAWCFTTTAGNQCGAGAIASGTTTAPGTSASSGGATPASGTTYFACVRARDTSNDYGAWACSNGARFDTAAPPTVTTLATPGTTLVPPALTWSTVNDPGSGVAFYRVYRAASAAGPWSQVSPASGPSSGSFTDSAAPFGTSWYRVQAVDAAGNEAGSSNLVAVLYHRMPSIAPTSPSSGATGVASSPALRARYDDPDGDSGAVDLQVCPTSACTSTLWSTTVSGVAAGTDAVAVASGLAAGGSYWWRARAVDANGAVTGWSAPWSFTTSAPTIGGSSPGSLPQGRKGATIRLTGTGFADGALVDLGPGMTVVSTTWVSATIVDVVVDVAGTAAIGPRTITLTNPDGTSASTASGLTVTAAAISVAISTLGVDDTARVMTAPWGVSFGAITAGAILRIGGSGTSQQIPGPAMQLQVTSDTDYVVQASSSDWARSSGGATMPVGALSWRRSGSADPWSSFTTAATTVGDVAPAGSSSFEHDFELRIPAGQPAGSYDSVVRYDVIAAP